MAAVVADPARDLRIDHGGVPDRPAGHAIAEGVDDARKLVSGDGVGEQAHLVRGEVGSADPAPVDTDHHLTGRRRGDRHLDELEVVRFDKPDCAHRYISPSCATMRRSSETTAGSVGTSMTLQTPLLMARSSAGRRPSMLSTCSPWPPIASARRSYRTPGRLLATWRPGPNSSSCS